MTNRQFRVLYREFLFRLVDLELLSAHAQGDMTRLFGQFAALLVFLSILFTFPALGISGGGMSPESRLMLAWSGEHFLIATTMLVVGLFAVLSWDSTFPDRRDVLVLAPLPVRARTMFLAKVAGVASSLCLTVVVLHAVTGLGWPLALNTQTPAQTVPAFAAGRPAVVIPASGGFWGLLRLFAAYWATMLAAGAFIFCCVLGVQGMAAQILPRRLFLRVSSWMQLAAFSLFVSGYFLQPMAPTPRVLAAAQGQGLLAWSPSYWFLGLFQQLSGSPALATLAHHAWIGLAVAMCATAAAYALSYFRTLRKIVEEPDIAPGLRAAGWLPGFGNAFPTAITQFSIRTLLRSRQHRIILAFHLGVAFALTIFFLKSPAAQRLLFEAWVTDLWRQVNSPVLAASMVVMGFWVVGTRVVFSMPLDLGANWIFRIAPTSAGPQCLAARRRSLLVLSLAPAWIGSAVLFLWMWPWRTAAGHLVVLGLIGMILAELCLQGSQKIPFTCSYLPGRSNFHMTFWLCIGLLVQVVNKAAEFERQALERPARYAAILTVLGVVFAAARWRTSRSADDELQFEEVPPWELVVLGLTGTEPLAKPDNNATE